MTKWQDMKMKRADRCHKWGFFFWFFPCSSSSERRRGRLRVALPAGEVEDLSAEPRGEELPHLLPAVCRSSRRHPAEVSPQLSGHVPGTDIKIFIILTLDKPNQMGGGWWLMNEWRRCRWWVGAWSQTWWKDSVFFLFLSNQHWVCSSSSKPKPHKSPSSPRAAQNLNSPLKIVLKTPQSPDV